MNTNLAVVENLSHYIAQLENFPPLSEEEEKTLAYKVYDNNDLEAAKKMILSHLRFVVFIAKRYKNYNLPLEELIQEGNIGLMKAVYRFNPNHGVKLSSFAVHYIKSEICEYVICNWKSVKIATTKAQRKVFFNLRSMKETIEPISKKECESIAKELNVSTDDVKEMDARMHTPMLFLDMAQDDNITDQALIAKYNDPAAQIEEEDYQLSIKNKIMKVINTLPARESDIILSRKFMEPVITMRELAEKYNISIERVRQIETKIINKLTEIVSELL